MNSILAVQELEDTKYHEALFLDFDGNIAEGPGENLFILKDDQIFTPPLGNILAGITRSTIFELAKAEGLKITEKTLTQKDVYSADEAFFTGTAAEVTPVRSLDDKVIGSGELGPVTTKMRDIYNDTVRGKNPEYEKYLSYV